MAKKAKEKKDSNLLVYLVIIILLCLIILPPVFRTVFKKENNSSNLESSKMSTPKNSISVLSCHKRTTDNFSVVTSTTYKNNDISKIVITYTNMESSTTDDASQTEQTPTDNGTNQQESQTTENNQVDSTAPAVVDNVKEEIAVLGGIEGVKAQQSENVYKYIINIDDIGIMDLTTTLSMRVQTLSLQQNYYETLGYTCGLNAS